MSRSQHDFLNPFDLALIRFFNRFAHHSQLLDGTINLLATEHLFKGVFIVALLWWVWFAPSNDNVENRRIVIATLLSAILAVVTGRLLADYLLPFRLRPMQSPNLQFVIPYVVSSDALRGWSSFPSDHAMVFFALGTGLCFVAAPLGAAALAYVIVVICLPRIYLGLHYPTDILGGAVIGSLFALLANTRRLRALLARPALAWLDSHSASFYAAFFLFTAGVATLFDSVRHLAIAIRALMR